MKILITGGAGLVGSHCAEYFAKKGNYVIVLDNLMRSNLFGYDKKSVEYNWNYLAKYKNIKRIKGDVRNEKDVLKAIDKGVDAVIHTAGQPGVPLSVRIPKEDFDINAFGTLNVLECLRQKCPKATFVYTSTNKVYGENVDLIPLEEKERRYIYKNVVGVSEKLSIDLTGHTPYGACFDSDTEILTENGWKLFSELNSEKVATLNLKTNKMEFQEVIKFYEYNYQGKMFHQKNRRLDFLVTPNHRVLVSTRNPKGGINKPKLKLAKKIFGKCLSHIIVAEWNGGKNLNYFVLPSCKINGNSPHIIREKNIPIDKWLKFLGWYISEGHVNLTKNMNYRITLTTYSRHQEAIKVFKDMGYNPYCFKKDITVSNRQLYLYLKQFGKAKDKYIPREIKGSPKEKLKIILKSLINGDGNVQGRGYRYTTTSKKLADDVQEIALKCGFSANISNDGFYRINIQKTKSVQCNIQKRRSEWVDYKGKVWCISVPNKTVLVRRNGKPFFSGNSKYVGDIYTQEYAHIYGMKTAVFRMSCIFGTRQFGFEDQGWVAWFIIANLLNKPITIYGNGKQVRDLLYVTDLVRAFEKFINSGIKHEVFNIGGGPEKTTSLLELLSEIEKLTGKKTKPAFSHWRPSDQKVYISDITKVKRELNWQPRIGVSEGIKRLLKWIKENKGYFS